jgi:retinol dehydrogenase-12
MKEFETQFRYSQSKLANVLYTKELAKRYPNITSVAIHPGRVDTNLLDTYHSSPSMGATFQKMIDLLIMVPVDKGALNQLWAATAKKGEVKCGSYYSPVAKAGGESCYAKDEKLAANLWNWIEAEITQSRY